MYQTLPLMLGQLNPINLDPTPKTTDGKPMPGGNILVLLAHGSAGHADDETTTKDNDPVSISWELSWWANEWAQTQGNPVLKGTRNNHTAYNRANEYLTKHMNWAHQNHNGYPQFINDLQRLDLMLQNALGFIRHPTPIDGLCLHCYSNLHRLINPKTGLETDRIECTKCNLEVNLDTYDNDLRTQLINHTKGK
jgi:hypothetical protein